jgi:hypothetical protein
MHRLLNKGLVALVVATLTVLALSASAAKPKPMTILDYYLLMPQKYLRYAGGDSAEARNAALYVSDVENGYLQARQPNGEFYSALALFKMPDGGDLVAVENRECARGCNEEFYLLTYRKGRWIDVTKKMLPVISDEELRAGLEKQFRAREGFQPHVLHRLSGGGAPIDVSEYWTGLGLGQLEWVGGEFVYKPLASVSAHASRNVLASVSNERGDRLEIIAVEPQLSNRLPLRGRLNVKVAYELRSAPACRIWARPVVLEQRLPDEFTHPSMLYLQGSGELMTWFGFDNEAHLQQFKVVMVDEEKKNLLTLNYNVDARWEGRLECPTFDVGCFPNDASPNAPLACMVYPSGVRPDQKFDYTWSVSSGTIMSGQGTRRIILNGNAAQHQGMTATVDVSGLPGKCVTKASHIVQLPKLTK